MGRIKDLLIEYQDMNPFQFKAKITQIKSRIEKRLNELTQNSDSNLLEKINEDIESFIDLLFSYTYVNHDLQPQQVQHYIDILDDWIVRYPLITINGENIRKILTISEEISSQSSESDLVWQLENAKKELEGLKNQNHTISSEAEKEYEDRIKELTTKIERFEKEKEKETEEIDSIITYLGSVPQEISEEQTFLKKQRKRFNIYANIFLIISITIAMLLGVNVIFPYLDKLPKIENVGQYLALTFTIMFPMFISLLFFKYVNNKNKEIEKINAKSILIHEVENALKSYNVMLRDKELKEKTISSIDMVIKKVFNTVEKESIEERNTIEINDLAKVTKMITDTIKVSK